MVLGVGLRFRVGVQVGPFSLVRGQSAPKSWLFYSEVPGDPRQCLNSN